jgi:hypothetical protein
LTPANDDVSPPSDRGGFDNIAAEPPMPVAPTPMELLAGAVQRGMPIDLIARLLELQERFERNEAKKAFDSAMAKAAAEFPVLRKTELVDFRSERTGQRTRYRFANLADVVGAVAPILGKYDLHHRFDTIVEPNKITVACIISHKLGHSIRTELHAGADTSGQKNAIQAMGSSITYLSRYTLMAACGLAAEEDDDGRGMLPPPEPRTELKATDAPKQPKPPKDPQQQARNLSMTKEQILAEVEAAAAQGSEAFNKWWYDEDNFTSGKRDVVQDANIGPKLRALMDMADKASKSNDAESGDQGAYPKA